uniref:CX domain-containing protein n=1 Tax=Meloidogyne enterolobii TaxID=390850 RepID=A0A6V7W6B2_MELEN|nr:unnamed protein product [Meloidogyne enterolobii]
MRNKYTQIWSILFAFFLCFDHFSVICKRSGIFGSRGGSSRNGHGYSSGIGRSRYPSSHTNYGGSGRRSITDRLLGRNKGGGYGGHRNRGVMAGAASGGLLGHGTRKSGGFLGGGGNKYRSSGIGSRSRAGTFKNMLVGAAGGFLAYKAGKAIIKNVARPMMWNNRPYYWGPQYHPSYQGGGYGGGYGGGGGGYGAAPSKTMCRMAIEPDDPVLGQVYMSDNTRPKEIVWTCEIQEECCGYECCPRY